jgi:arginine/ornithine N-succinyltransferase beta subunit
MSDARAARREVVLAYGMVDLAHLRATGEYVDIRDGLPMLTAEADRCRSATADEIRAAADAWAHVARVAITVGVEDPLRASAAELDAVAAAVAELDAAFATALAELDDGIDDTVAEWSAQYGGRDDGGGGHAG